MSSEKIYGIYRNRARLPYAIDRDESLAWDSAERRSGLRKGQLEHFGCVCRPITITEGPAANECTWTPSEEGVWETGCGDRFFITSEAGPKENNMHFCHQCGASIVECAFVPDPD